MINYKTPEIVSVEKFREALNNGARIYVVKINHTEGLYHNEIAIFEDIQEAYSYYLNFDIESLQENEELELEPYDENGFADWTEEELISINQPVQWVTRSN